MPYSKTIKIKKGKKDFTGATTNWYILPNCRSQTHSQQDTNKHQDSKQSTKVLPQDKAKKERTPAISHCSFPKPLPSSRDPSLETNALVFGNVEGRTRNTPGRSRDVSLLRRLTRGMARRVLHDHTPCTGKTPPPTHPHAACSL